MNEVSLASKDMEYESPVDKINDPNEIYFCDSEYFSVKEIEVFQIRNLDNPLKRILSHFYFISK